jgi:gamma-glutamyltranspeptidase/glutathione hydrolase
MIIIHRIIYTVGLKVQVLLNMIHHTLSPQDALDLPRFYISPTDTDQKFQKCILNLEDGIDPDVIELLKKRGHDVKVLTGTERLQFGKGQVIVVRQYQDRLVLVGGSDRRGDGLALGW